MRHFDDWLEAYLKYASVSEAPLRSHWWVGVATINGALQRKVWIDQTFFQWLPNMYVLFVGPPGIATKSTTSGVGMSLLKRIEGVSFGPDAVTWPELLRLMGENSMDVIMPDGSWVPMSCMIVHSSEWGSFLDAADGKMIDVLVDLWDGKKGLWEKGTKTAGHDKIENPWIHVVANTTTQWMEDNIGKVALQGGFFSRHVVVYTPGKEKLVPYVDEAIPREHEALGDRLVEDLIRISQLRGPIQIDSGARDFGRRWYNNLFNAFDPLLENDRISGYVGRKQTHLHKVAIALMAGRRDELVILREDYETGLEMLEKMESDIPRAIRRVDETMESRTAQQILDFLNSQGPSTLQTLYRGLWRQVGGEEFKRGLTAVLNNGLIKKEAIHGTELFSLVTGDMK